MISTTDRHEDFRAEESQTAKVMLARRPAGAVLAGLIVLAVVRELAASASATNKDVWAEKWCELNDCQGQRAAQEREGHMAKVRHEHDKATRRYEATGEIKAINGESVKHAYFGYDGPVLDHPAFPGVAAEHAERAERMHEENAIGFRRIVEKRAVIPPQPGGGYLLPNSEEASQLAVREQDDTAIGMARRRHAVLKEQLRMMAELIQSRMKEENERLSKKIEDLEALMGGLEEYGRVTLEG